MNTPTLSQLADIGAAAACVQLDLEQDDSEGVYIRAGSPGYDGDAATRRAFVKAVLDAVGYKFPVDPEREAFDDWVKDAICLEGGDRLFEAWKAGRAMLRGKLEIRDARSEQEHAAEIAQPAPSSTERLGAFYKQVYEQFKIEVQKAVQESKSATAAKPAPAPAPAPETFEAHGLTWIKHTPGDPCPCDRKALVQVFWDSDFDNDSSGITERAADWDWECEGRGMRVVGWRYADAP